MLFLHSNVLGRKALMLKVEYSCIKFSGLEWELPLFLVFKKKKKNEMHLRRRLDPLPVRMVSHKRGQPKTLTLHADVKACLLKRINEAFSHNKRSPRAAKAEIFPTAGHHTGKHNSNVGSR